MARFIAIPGRSVKRKPLDEPGFHEEGGRLDVDPGTFEQDPINLLRLFRITDQRNLDLQRNSRVGATFSAGLGGGHAIRASVSRGAYTTIGADFTSVAVGYNYAWAP